MRHTNYRCYTTLKEEKLIPDNIQKELKYLRNRLKEKDDEIYYLICCILGDEPSDPKISEKFDKRYHF